MAQPTTDDYKRLIRQFAEGEIAAADFARAYPALFKSDEGLHSEDAFAILDSLFGDVDAFTANATLRTANDLHEGQLRHRAKMALESLDRISE